MANDAVQQARDELVRHWGNMGTLWGINRVMAQIHALLLSSTQPLTLNDLCKQLGISRGSASMNVRELLGWGLAKKVFPHGERKDHYVAEDDISRILSQILKVRKTREFEPTVAALQRCLQILEREGKRRDSEEYRRFKRRLQDFKSLADTFAQLADKLLSEGDIDLGKIASLGD